MRHPQRPQKHCSEEDIEKQIVCYQAYGSVVITVNEAELEEHREEHTRKISIQ